MEHQLLFRTENGNGVFERIERFVVRLGVALQGFAAFFGVGDVDGIGAGIGVAERFGDNVEGPALTHNGQPTVAFATRPAVAGFADQLVRAAVERDIVLERGFETGCFGCLEESSVGPHHATIGRANPARCRQVFSHLGERP